VLVGARADGGHVEVFVKDDGPGIPAESLGRVFERFYRVDKARSREQGGTGLGLSIVKHIVQSHGGRVWAKSELGHGATFFFTLPQDDGGVQQALL
jgi:two-component system phosphate regulon sensor histidine kinase PhoR